ncbi:glutathione S-transferase Mu 1-like isoform X2 [Ptychodera flava]|uniref:glutathione S-transferase Mu 1-like isoform X1 n=1 Tax=Ptychodera flava TaxID=63121 RepID=UPI003969E2DA
MPVLLGYWKVRGLAQPIRYILEYAGIEYEEKFYELGPAPEYSKDSWLKEKHNLGLSFPNVPYMFDGDIKLTQSNIILRYLAGKTNLLGANDDERMRADWVNEVARDVRLKMGMAAYNPKWEELKPGIVKYAGEMLASFSDFLDGNKWFAGENLTYADFVMHELLDRILKVDSSLLDNYKTLQDLKDRFEAIPAIAAYRETDLCKSFPIYTEAATFGGVVID